MNLYPTLRQANQFEITVLNGFSQVKQQATLFEYQRPNPRFKEIQHRCNQIKNADKKKNKKRYERLKKGFQTTIFSFYTPKTCYSKAEALLLHLVESYFNHKDIPKPCRLFTTRAGFIFLPIFMQIKLNDRRLATTLFISFSTPKTCYSKAGALLLRC